MRYLRPRFKIIAPGLEISHDPTSFIDDQKFTVINANSEYGIIIHPVLVFAFVERLVA
ncbi:hypothetical protein F4820DRAFT_436634 [Hypoxylon rubiginosum]|uniref:Uncharacterized protein n=1 Tax=Hypoxylon rubiginosum TaxID=110542 RepID=A0ACB9YMW1_9PEZI|nr:hypothetical protein F4820DRAFT_436634 [Hypoxylon rubiginosum]